MIKSGKILIFLNEEWILFEFISHKKVNEDFSFLFCYTGFVLPVVAFRVITDAS